MKILILLLAERSYGVVLPNAQGRIGTRNIVKKKGKERTQALIKVNENTIVSEKVSISSMLLQLHVSTCTVENIIREKLSSTPVLLSSSPTVALTRLVSIHIKYKIC